MVMVMVMIMLNEGQYGLDQRVVLAMTCNKKKRVNNRVLTFLEERKYSWPQKTFLVPRVKRDEVSKTSLVTIC